MNIEQTVQLAMQHHQSGRTAQAESMYRQVLAQQPNQPDALHLLGVLCGQGGNLPAAIELINRAIAINPRVPDYYGNLGEFYRRAGNLDMAAAQLGKALQLKADFPTTHFNLGLTFLGMGRGDQAIAAFSQAIHYKPDYVEAYSNLGMLLMQAQRPQEAITVLAQALRLRPDIAELHANLGNALRSANQPDQAIAAYRRALELKGDLAEVHNNLGSILQDCGQLDQAIASFRRAVAANPQHPQFHQNLGLALRAQGNLGPGVAELQAAVQLNPKPADSLNILGCLLRENGQVNDAIACFERSLSLNPNAFDAYNNLGVILNELEQYDRAEAVCRKALQFKPDFPEALSNLGNALKGKRQFDQAKLCFLRAIELRPTYAEAHNNLGGVLYDQLDYDGAIARFNKAIELKPDYAEAYSNLATTVRDAGQLVEAVEALRKAIALRPNSGYLSQLLISLLIHPDYDAKSLRDAHRPWEEQYARPLAQQIKVHQNEPNPDRRLRIGYVSSNLHMHPIGALMKPVLANHDAKNVEVFVYADIKRPDDLTQTLRETAHVWRDTLGKSDQDLAALIRSDRIDILIDLVLHTLGNRLLVFARKPAPVQVTWLGYPGTTGLSAIDYRLSDPFLDPPGKELAYSEKTLWLPHCFWCYEPIVPTPEVNDLPAAKAGYITFGCLNNFAKVTMPTRHLWARVLQAVPQSHMQILAPVCAERQKILDLFAGYGIQPQRVEFINRLPHDAYFRQLQQIDIGLDPIPYPGHTTTLDALWMGVPVVSLAASTAVSRGGSTMLNNVGLSELLTHSSDEYLAKATALANDLPRLSELRKGLRQRMEQSPLTNGKQFANDLETLYRQMWTQWCKTRT